MATFIEYNGDITQGTVIDGVNWGPDDDSLGIVLTNECDFENDKAGFVIAAALVPAADTIQLSKEFLSRMSGLDDSAIIKKKRWDSIQSWLETFIYNKNVSRYYLIRPGKDMDWPLFFVDFQHIISIPISSVASLQSIAQLPSPYKEQMMVQFASYIARIPVDREEDVISVAEELIAPRTHE